MGMFAVIFMGNSLTDSLGISEWGAVKYINENKWTAGIGTFFVCNNIASSCMSTQAFEIYVDGVLKYSKLETGAMPSVQHIN
jgi:hypothetical protein